MPIQSRPTLLNLPRELRQHILGYVFEDALEKDNRFNTLIREPRLESYRSRHFFARDFPPSDDETYELKRFIRHMRSIFSIFKGKWTKFDTANIHAPNIFGAATLVSGISKEIADDMRFVLGQALNSLERMQEIEMAREEMKGDPKERSRRAKDAWITWGEM